MKINHFLRNFLQLHFPTSFTCKYPNAYLNKTERFLSAKLLWLELNITRRVKITSEPAGCGHVRAALPATSSRGPTTGTDRDPQAAPELSWMRMEPEGTGAPGWAPGLGAASPARGTPGHPAPRAPAPGAGRSLAKVFNTFVRTILP